VSGIDCGAGAGRQSLDDLGPAVRVRSASSAILVADQLVRVDPGSSTRPGTPSLGVGFLVIRA